MSETIEEDVLRAICRLIGDDAERDVRVSGLVESLGIRHYQLYRAVAALADSGYLDYLGAGPRVRLTEAGLLYCEQTRSSAAGGS